MEQTQMRTWAEIDLDALAHNYRALRSNLEPGCRFVGVVKANAYGHGGGPRGKEAGEIRRGISGGGLPGRGGGAAGGGGHRAHPHFGGHAGAICR